MGRSRKKPIQNSHVAPKKVVSTVGYGNPPRPITDVSWHDLFLETFSTSANVTKSAEIAGVDALTAYRHKHKYPEFAEAWEIAKEKGKARLEDVAIERALTISDTLLIFLLKAHDPAKYGNKLDVTTKGDKLKGYIGFTPDDWDKNE